MPFDLSTPTIWNDDAVSWIVWPSGFGGRPNRFVDDGRPITTTRACCVTSCVR